MSRDKPTNAAGSSCHQKRSCAKVTRRRADGVRCRGLTSRTAVASFSCGQRRPLSAVSNSRRSQRHCSRSLLRVFGIGRVRRPGRSCCGVLRTSRWGKSVAQVGRVGRWRRLSASSSAKWSWPIRFSCVNSIRLFGPLRSRSFVPATFYAGRLGRLVGPVGQFDGACWLARQSLVLQGCKAAAFRHRVSQLCASCRYGTGSDQTQVTVMPASPEVPANIEIAIANTRSLRVHT